eukprot:TRINITY_DN13740_c0_g1_i4.p1 TRINITY_DN13740_c0_g1~~TRINITY_DN13740_c0_g1_i4.p1  ORF type:complete len:315 (-),score=39.12 TRINITY_DN13740_c0_g1_i4:37-924(-)
MCIRDRSIPMPSIALAISKACDLGYAVRENFATLQKGWSFTRDLLYVIGTIFNLIAVLIVFLLLLEANSIGQVELNLLSIVRILGLVFGATMPYLFVMVYMRLFYFYSFEIVSDSECDLVLARKQTAEGEKVLEQKPVILNSVAMSGSLVSLIVLPTVLILGFTFVIGVLLGTEMIMLLSIGSLIGCFYIYLTNAMAGATTISLSDLIKNKQVKDHFAKDGNVHEPWIPKVNNLVLGELNKVAEDVCIYGDLFQLVYGNYTTLLYKSVFLFCIFMLAFFDKNAVLAESLGLHKSV